MIMITWSCMIDDEKGKSSRFHFICIVHFQELGSNIWSEMGIKWLIIFVCFFHPLCVVLLYALPRKMECSSTDWRSTKDTSFPFITMHTWEEHETSQQKRRGKNQVCYSGWILPLNFLVDYTTLGNINYTRRCSVVKRVSWPICSHYQFVTAFMTVVMAHSLQLQIKNKN